MPVMLQERNLDVLFGDALGSARCEGLEVTAESGAGENYGSTLLWVDAKIHDSDTSLPMVAKKLPRAEFLRTAFNVNVTFVKEVKFYQIVVPAIEALQNELKVDPSLQIDAFPKLYGARTGALKGVSEDAILLLEDLCASGFRTIDRREGLDVAHCKLVLREVAKFHALGIALKTKKPDVFDGPIKEATIFFLHDRGQDQIEEAFRSLQDNCLKLVEAEIPEARPYMDRLRKVVLRGAESDPTALDEPFCSIVHGDLWTNNIMFSYDGHGAPARVKLIDYQITSVRSVVSDLYFFLFTSTDSDAFTQHFDELVEFYFEGFISFMQVLGVPTENLTWDAFQREIDTKVFAVLPQIFYMITVIKSEKKVEHSEVSDMENFSSKLGVSESARKRYMEIIENWVKTGRI